MANGDQLYTGDSDPDDHGRQPWIRDAQRSPSPDACGPQAFTKRIRRTLFPARFRAPSNVTKYSEDTNLIVWLEDFRLAYRVGGADDDLYTCLFTLRRAPEPGLSTFPRTASARGVPRHIRATQKFLGSQSLQIENRRNST
jgi:hypothetical protein